MDDCRILIVEDDETIARIACERFEAWGYHAKKVENLSEVMSEFAAYCPHLVIMDITLPFYSGYHWCSEIRRVSTVPVVFLSSATDNMNIVMAVEMGADDFVPKPFDMDVLLAKVQAVLRRTYDYAHTPQLLECRGAILNADDASLTNGERRVELTRNEYRILLTLIRDKGRVVTRERLMLKIWESDDFIDDNTLTVNITRLRRKLDEVGLGDVITTRKGTGYLLEE